MPSKDYFTRTWPEFVQEKLEGSRNSALDFWTKEIQLGANEAHMITPRPTMIECNDSSSRGMKYRSDTKVDMFCRIPEHYKNVFSRSEAGDIIFPWREQRGSVKNEIITFHNERRIDHARTLSHGALKKNAPR
eukprot:CAMPEP_0184675184 /NCGR_PEP_ID=MMETSP0308-20130426/87650_1 /TAXON_ID=38269 /ORGANISM="Gloeochaete witrockiana, Strain SAG 46.84" /LENGTH=132 /DNA_ID=CAMNT_0027122867 /DNA_START=237 /DNA_END=635 /DNA_ORIENTATION=+